MASEEGVPEETKTLSGADGNDREALNVDRFSEYVEDMTTTDFMAEPLD